MRRKFMVLLATILAVATMLAGAGTAFASAGEVHTHTMDSFGAPTRTGTQFWSTGLTAESYRGSLWSYVVVLSDTWGQFEIHRLNDNGTVDGYPVNNIYESIGAGFTSLAILDGTSGRNLATVYNRSTGAVKAFKLSDSGVKGADVTQQALGRSNWGSGWTSVEVIDQEGPLDGFFLMNSKTGKWQIEMVRSDDLTGFGTIAGSAPKGFSIAKPYRVGGAGPVYVLLLSEATGDVEIRKLASGTIDLVTFKSRWTTDWSTAEPFTNAQRGTQLYLMKWYSGRVHVNDLKADGTVGTLTYSNESSPWTQGWTSAVLWPGSQKVCTGTWPVQTCRQDPRTNLFILKKGPYG